MVASVMNARTTAMISGHSTSKAERGQKFIRSDTLQTTTIVRLGKDGVSVFSGPRMIQEIHSSSYLVVTDCGMALQATIHLKTTGRATASIQKEAT
mmetsp:Transcript_29353/g.43095  ORF Transcript_29353/g.43095 Transcript_29353/m.43095 type:complete len:96 (+) Transcript_29353:1930-2217(+)